MLVQKGSFDLPQIDNRILRREFFPVISDHTYIDSANVSVF
jgi:hypothetical protein